MRSTLPDIHPRWLQGMVIAAAFLSLSSAQANTAPQTLSEPQTPAPQQTLSSAPDNAARNLTCDALLETAGYQQAALQSAVEKRVAAEQAGQLTPELERLVHDSQARLDRTQGQINTACAA